VSGSVSEGIIDLQDGVFRLAKLGAVLRYQEIGYIRSLEQDVLQHIEFERVLFLNATRISGNVSSQSTRSNSEREKV